MPTQALPINTPPKGLTPPGANNAVPFNRPNGPSISSVKPQDLPELVQYFDDAPALVRPFNPGKALAAGAGGAGILAANTLPFIVPLQPAKPFDEGETFTPGKHSIRPFGKVGGIYKIEFKVDRQWWPYFSGKPISSERTYSEIIPGMPMNVEVVNFKEFELQRRGEYHEQSLIVKYLDEFGRVQDFGVTSYYASSLSKNPNILNIVEVEPPPEKEKPESPNYPPLPIPNTPPNRPRPVMPGQEGPDEIKPFRRPSQPPASPKPQPPPRRDSPLPSAPEP